MFFNPVYKQFSNKYGNNRWRVFSLKLRRDVYLYSDLEYANWLELENNPDVKYFCEQPLEIKYREDSGRSSRSIPDMYVLYENGTMAIQEVKYEKDLQKENVVNQIKIQKRWCTENNFKHETVTEKSLSQSALLLSNLKLLSKYDALDNPHFLEEIKQYLSHKPKTLNQISIAMGLDFEEIAENFFSLIKSHKVNANIKELYLGPLMEVWINE